MEEDGIKRQMKEYNRQVKEYNEIYANSARKLKLSETTLGILYTLQNNQFCTQKDLCTVLLLPKQSVNSALKKLEREGYLRMTYAENSKKMKKICLTEKGIVLAKNTADRLWKAELDAIGRLSDQDRADFIRIFSQYIVFLRTEIKKM